MVMLLPSIQPSSRRRWVNAARFALQIVGVVVPRKPIVRTLTCRLWALTECGQPSATAALGSEHEEVTSAQAWHRKLSRNFCVGPHLKPVPAK